GTLLLCYHNEYHNPCQKGQAGVSLIKVTETCKICIRAKYRLMRSIRCFSPAQVIFKQGETDMGDKGKKDKGKREEQKKAQHNPKEKRKLKKEKKNK
ncbi:MAG: hypothetical protein MUP70_02990, partial [Candidatus Aminicenantes bacterium]|nr:hypothetical protein [Candidatus Aminicenantes bacterium]